MKRPVATTSAPQAIGPYSQAVEVGDFVFLSGQIGLDPASGTMVAGGVEAECRRVLANMKAVLEAAGLGMDDVVKTTIYLADLADFAAVNEIYGEAFREPYPARAALGVAALPKGARVEIEAVARKR